MTTQVMTMKVMARQVMLLRMMAMNVTAKKLMMGQVMVLKVMATKGMTMQVSDCVESDGDEGHGVYSDKLSFIFFVVTVSLSNLESISKVYYL